MRVLRAALVAASFASFPATLPALADTPPEVSAVAFNVPAQPLGTALIQFSQQADVQITVQGAHAGDLQAPALIGDYSVDDGLIHLLAGSGLYYTRTGSHTYVVQGADAGPNGGAPAAEFAGAGSVESMRRSGIEEVIVTARRREESVQDIPISITALSSEDLRGLGVRNFADLEGIVPGLNLGGGGNGVKKDSSPYIRGVGQRETKVTLDPAVATYIDGIYIGRGAGALLDVADVESIQVLRGPQGTLFGRNATGGALSVALKKPQPEWGGEAQVNVGNYGRQDVIGILNAPLVGESLLGRLMVASINSDGFFTNVMDNTRWGGDNRITAIGQLRWNASDALTFDMLGERTRIRETPRPQRCKFVREPGFTTLHTNILVEGDPNGRPLEAYCRDSEALPVDQFASDLAIGDRLQPRGRYWVDTATAALTATTNLGDAWGMSDLAFKSISAWRKTEQIADEDLDSMGISALMRIQPTFDQTTQRSQEFQLSGRLFDDRLFFSTGVYYFDEKTPNNVLHLSAGVSPNIDSGGLIRTNLAEAAKEILQTDNESYAWYGQLDFDVTPELQLSAGLRWTEEKRWSRYSKGYLDIDSVFEGVLFDLDVNGLIAVFRDPAYPGMTPILDWQYGGRFYDLVTEDNGDIIHRETFMPGVYPGDELSTRDSAWTPMFSAKYRAPQSVLETLHLDQAMAYATFSRGFHSGGVTAGAIDHQDPPQRVINWPEFTGIPCPGDRQNCRMDTVPEPGYGVADPQLFEPETVTNYELGLKLTGFDRRLQANLAMFYMDYENMQVTAVGERLGIPIPYIDNVGSAAIKGLELEMVAALTPSWNVMFSGSYTNADIKEWNARQVVLTIEGQDSGIQYDIDRSDERMPRVPRVQLFLASDYTFMLPQGGSITPSLSLRYSSSVYHGFDRGSWIYTNGGHYYNRGGDLPPYWGSDDWWQTDDDFDPYIEPDGDAKWATTSKPTTFLDARIAWLSADGRLEAALWGRNLTNRDDYLVGGIPLADVTGAVGQVYANPRTFGLSMSYSFGQP